MVLDKKQLQETKGGFLNGTLVNAFARAINSLLELGRSLGSAIRRIKQKNYC